MKKLITLMMLLVTVAALAQGTRTLEIKKVEEQSPIDSDTRLMVWDSLNFGKVKYTKIGDLITLFGGTSSNIYNTDGVIPNGTNRTISVPVFSGAQFTIESDESSFNLNPGGLFLDGNSSNAVIENDNGYLFLGTNTSLLGSNGLLINIGTSGVIDEPSPGEVLMAVDNTGKVEWGNAGWSHTASQDIDMSGNDVDMGTDSRFIFESGAGILQYDTNDSALKYNEPFEAREIRKQSGTSAQFLKADGSVDSNTYATISEVPTSKLTHRSFETDSIAALPLEDIKASKLIYANVDRPNETPADTLYFTYPDLTVETIDADETWAPAFGSENGQVISLIPAPGSAMNKKISTKADVRGIHALIYKGGDNFVESLSSSEWIFESYTQPTSTNFIINSEFNNTSDVDYSGEFNITGGEVVYTHNAGFSSFTWDLSEDMVADETYNFTLDVSNLISGNARFRVKVLQSGSEVEVIGNDNYNSGVDVSFTAPSGANSTQLIIETSSSSSSFNFDNAILIKN